MTRHKAILLASFPKSGNTWLRFIIANLAAGPKAEPVDFHSIHEIVPSVDWKRKASKTIDGHSFYKTHEAYSSSFKMRIIGNNWRTDKAVLLVRNPLDVCASYYFYQSLENKLRIEEFIETKWQTEQWSEHCLTWLTSHLMKNKRLYILRYEELLKDTPRQIADCLEYFGIKADSHEIEVATEKSSFEKMREIEDTNGRRFQTQSRFVRSAGRIENPIYNIDQPSLSRLFYKDRHMARVFGYDIHIVH